MSRLELKGLQLELKQKRYTLSIEAKDAITSIRSILDKALVKPISEIDIEGLLVSAQRAAEIKKKFKEVLKNLEKINEELGE